jgi:hypothetical protein
MTFAGVIVNPLTAVRDRSQMRADHRGPVHALAPGAWCRPGRRRAPKIVAFKTNTDTSYRIDAGCRHGMTLHERLFHETRNLAVV